MTEVAVPWHVKQEHTHQMGCVLIAVGTTAVMQGRLSVCVWGSVDHFARAARITPLRWELSVVQFHMDMAWSLVSYRCVPEIHTPRRLATVFNAVSTRGPIPEQRPLMSVSV